MADCESQQTALRAVYGISDSIINNSILSTDGVFFYYLRGLMLFGQNLTFVRCLSLLSLI